MNMDALCVLLGVSAGRNNMDALCVLLGVSAGRNNKRGGITSCSEQIEANSVPDPKKILFLRTLTTYKRPIPIMFNKFKSNLNSDK